MLMPPSMTIRRSRSALLPLAFAVAGCAIGGAEDVEGVRESQEALSVNDWTASALEGGQSLHDVALATLNGDVVMVHSGSVDPNALYWSTFDGVSWSAEKKIGFKCGGMQPMLAGFNGYVYLICQGASGFPLNSNLMSRWDAVTKVWTQPTLLPFSSRGAPAIAAYAGRLYFVGVNNSTQQLWQASMDKNETISPMVNLPYMYSLGPVSLAAHGGRLWMAHHNGSSLEIVVNSFDGASWGYDALVPNGLNGAPQRTLGRATLAPKHAIAEALQAA
jgi:hypothetical protein